MAKKPGGGPAAPEAQAAARRELLTVVSAASPEEAWARLVAVQAEIALEPENGSKATAAARLVAEATGMLPAAGEGHAPLVALSLGMDAATAARLEAAIARARKGRKRK
jgi:hypothetical protein